MKTERVADSLTTIQQPKGLAAKDTTASTEDSLYEQFSQTLEKIVHRLSGHNSAEDHIMDGIELAKIVERAPAPTPVVPQPARTVKVTSEEKSQEKPVENPNSEKKEVQRVECSEETAPAETRTEETTQEDQSGEVEQIPAENNQTDGQIEQTELISQHVAVSQETVKVEDETPQTAEATEEQLDAEFNDENKEDSALINLQQPLEDQSEQGVANELVEVQGGQESEVTAAVLPDGLTPEQAIQQQTQPNGATNTQENNSQIQTAASAVTATNTASNSEAVDQSEGTTPIEESHSANPNEILAQNLAKIAENIAKNTSQSAKGKPALANQDNAVEQAISTALLRHLTPPPAPSQTASLPKPSAAQALQLLSNGDSGAMRTANYAGSARGDTPRAAVPKGQTKAAEARTMEKVENALKEVARSKDGKTISVRLEPSHLGEVKVDVSLREGNLHARLSADSAQVSAMLKERAHEVVTMLRKLGLHVDKVTVAVGSTEEQIMTTSDSFQSYQSFERFEDKKQQDEGQQQPTPRGIPLSAMMQRTQPQIMDHWIA